MRKRRRVMLMPRWKKRAEWRRMWREQRDQFAGTTRSEQRRAWRAFWSTIARKGQVVPRQATKQAVQAQSLPAATPARSIPRRKSSRAGLLALATMAQLAADSMYPSKRPARPVNGRPGPSPEREVQM